MLNLQVEGWSLRPLEMRDAPDLQRILEQYELAKKLTPIPHPFPKGAADNWLREKLEDRQPTNTSFGIIAPNGEVCGNVGFDLDDDRIVLGYYLDIPFWGKGVMSDAVTTVLGWLFDNSETALVHSGAFESNHASLAIQKKVGFTEVGRDMRYCAAQEQELAHIDTELSRDRFLKNGVGSDA